MSNIENAIELIESSGEYYIGIKIEDATRILELIREKAIQAINEPDDEIKKPEPTELATKLRHSWPYEYMGKGGERARLIDEVANELDRLGEENQVLKAEIAKLKIAVGDSQPPDRRGAGNGGDISEH